MITLGGLAADVESLFREKITDDPRNVHGAINDGLESLWQSMMQAQPEMFVAGPTSLAFASGAERATLTSLTDPVAAPTCGSTGVSTLAQASLSVTYTLVTDSGSETLESAATAFVRPINTVLSVTSPNYASGAIGWNVYVGDAAGRRAKQNTEPILFGNAWLEDPTGFKDTPQLPSPPAQNTTADDVFYLRKLEVLHTDGTYSAYNQSDIDSSLFRAAAGSIASNSDYQRYVFAFINQNQVEIRPPAGAALSTRYWYVRKLRRLRFANATLPFVTFPCQAFLKYFALSIMARSVHEYQASALWRQDAEAERVRAIQSILQANHGKDKRVVPYMR